MTIVYKNNVLDRENFRLCCIKYQQNSSDFIHYNNDKLYIDGLAELSQRCIFRIWSKCNQLPIGSQIILNGNTWTVSEIRKDIYDYDLYICIR